MTSSQFALCSSRIATADGVRPAAVHVRGEKIVAVNDRSDLPADIVITDVGDAVVMPGLVDVHVHINEPGRTEWEGFATATSAAAAGGVTTLVDMPLNSSPVTTAAAALEQKRAAASGKCRVDVGCYGGLIPGNAAEISGLAEAGVLGIKAFLCPSGLDEFSPATEADFQAAMPILARHSLPLLVHCELPSTAPTASHCRSYAEYLASRPDNWEIDAIAMMIRLCREHGCHVHIVHLSAATALEMIADAKAEGLPLTVETCPHYLSLCAEEIPDGDPRFKCAPPIRDAANRRQLWQALRDGLIDTIGSDHSPCLPEMKCLDTGDLTTAWGGIASLQWLLPLVWTAGRDHGFTLEELAARCCQQPARLLGFAGRKGEIATGCDADVAVWNPDAEFTITTESIHHRHPVTPYLGRTLRGVVGQTYLRGRLTYDDGRLKRDATGRLLTRPRRAIGEPIGI